jgi:hypothetical protein
MTAATSAVEVVSLPMSRRAPPASLAPPRISGFSTMMYAIVKKVAKPPRISRSTVEPRSEMWKNASSRERGGVSRSSLNSVAMRVPPLAGGVERAPVPSSRRPPGVNDGAGAACC